MDGNLTKANVAGALGISANKLLWISLLMILIGVGGAVYAQVIGHHHAFANTREMPWGMLIGAYAYFAIISTGLCILAAFSHAFGGNRMAPLANRMVWLSIIMILGAFTVIGLEIENSWRMPLGVILHPNVTSNIWWMGTLYGMAVGIMFLELFLILAGRYGMAIVFGVAGAVAEALANSNLGSVFASLNSRPFWYGAQLPVFFLACAVLSGAAAVVLFTYYSHNLQQRKMTEGTAQGVQTAGKIMVLMIFFVSLATAWKFVNAYLGTQEMVLAVDSMVRGPLAISFWVFEIAIGLVIPFALLIASRLLSVPVMAVAALLVLIGQFFSRFNMVVAGQIVPNNHGFVGVPNYLSYSPTLLEYLLVVAGLGVVLLGFVVGERFFDKTFNLESSH
jgi:Ni/Fe-hydrogenase subunit HybB-like protein